ncbi:MAG: FtsW/RodA/SpoVE family cell cycle protein [Desulfotomaculum sp.]|nr:FtsW/RodA/SpoVE family cell cycle protein [Desulfotomaculum sp.]MCL0081314.1 FtsW/RodA/SpoVE family cell cycle protein [Peptococcaceae bacterium]
MATNFWVIFLIMGTVLVFIAISIFWQFTKYQADPYLLPIVAALTSSGLIFIMRLQLDLALRQFIWLLLALLVLTLITVLIRNYHILAEYQYIYALTGVIALLLPIFWGIELGGARSWLDFGLFHVQTSEFVKILLVLFLAAFLAENKSVLTAGTRTFFSIPVPGCRELGPLIMMLGVALILLVFQRDLGTALIYFCTFLAMVYAATARVFYIIFGMLAFLFSSIICYYIFNHVRARVDVWLNPWPYFETTGFQIIQSLFAIGSGGLTGAGLGAGSPYLIPAVHTDFIFAAIAEEMGLLGGCGILVLFILFIYRGIKIALAAPDDFSALLATGLTALMALQTFIIVAGVLKLLPLTGVTLPYISYGGSSLVANFILLALLLNISHRAGSAR